MEINDRLSTFMHQVRWLAATAVVIGHLRSLMFVNYDLVEQKTLLIKAFYFITGFGHQAVMVFFVLSGFLIGGKVISRVRKNEFNTLTYLIDRVSRLYVVLLFALLAGYILDTIGLNFFNGAGIYTGVQEFDFGVMHEAPPATRLGINTLFSNFLMLQTILTPTFGSNGPLWSLAYEFWYYLLFPPLARMFLGEASTRRRICFGMITFAIFMLLPRNIAQYFIVWLIGATITFIKKPIFSFPTIAIVIFVAVLAIVRFKLVSYFTADLLVGITFALVLISYLGVSDRGKMSKAKNFHISMSGFSYSLYALHFPMILFIVAVLNTLFGAGLGYQPSATSFCLFLLILFFIYFYSYIVSRITEEKTGAIRSRIYQIIKRNQLKNA